MVTNIVTTGRIQLVDLNDAKQLQLFIANSQPKTQIYDKDSNIFMPDWTINKPVLTPQLFVAGTSTDIINNAKSITWHEDEIGNIITSNSNYTLGTNNKTLTINRNVMPSNEWYRITYKETNTYSFIPTFNGLVGREVLEETVVKDSIEVKYSPNSSNVEHYISHYMTYVYVSSAKTIALSGRIDDDINIFLNDTSVFARNVTGEYSTSLSLQSGWNKIDILHHEVTGSDYVRFDTKISDLVDKMSYNKNESKTFFCEVIFTDPDTRFDVATIASIELEKSLTGTKGAKGDSGDNAIIGLLTNEYHVIPTNSSGGDGVFTNVTTEMKIYSGRTDNSSSWTVTATPSSGVTGTLSTRTYTVNAMTTDTGYVDLTASRSGFTSITKRFNLVKHKQGATGNTGATGSEALEFWLMNGATVIQKSSTGVYTPSTITFRGMLKRGASSSPEVLQGRFKIFESTNGGNTYTEKYSSASSETTKVWTPSANITHLRVELHRGDGSVKLDEQTIPVISDGIKGVKGDNVIRAVVWTPDGDVLKNSNGTVSTQADLYDGSTPIPAESYWWYRENPQVNSEGGNGWETLDAGKDNLIANSDFILQATKDSYATPISIILEDNTNLTERFSGKTVTFSYYVHNVGARTNGNQGTPLNERFGIHGSILWADSTGVKANVSTFPFSAYLNISTNNSRVSMTTTIDAPVGYDRIVNFGFSFQPYTKPASTNNEVWKIGQPKLEYGSVSKYNVTQKERLIKENDNNLYNKNLVPNSTGDLGLDGWFDWGGSSTGGSISVSNDGINGSKSLIRNVTATNGGFSTPKINVVAGNVYTISYWIKSTEASIASQVIKFRNINNVESNPINVTDQNITLVPNTWTRVSVTITVPEGQLIMYTTPRCAGGTYPCTLSIAHVKIEEGGILTDWTPSPLDNSTLTSHPTIADGKNKWIFRRYTDELGLRIPTYTDLKVKTVGRQELIPDRTDIVKSIGDNYIGYLRTAVYVSTNRNISLTFNHDDSVNVLINGNSIYSRNSVGTSTVPLILRKGWNNIEFIYKEMSGGDGIFNITSLLSPRVDEMNCHYALEYGELRGIDEIVGYNTPRMRIPADGIVGVESFKCIIEYNGTQYSDIVALTDITDPIVVSIIGANKFKNGEGSSTFTARVYQNGLEVDNDNSGKYIYNWYIYDQNDIVVSGWRKTGKSIVVTSDDITNHGRLVCEVELA